MVPNLLTTEELAERLNVKRQTIYANLCRLGHFWGLTPVRLGGRYLRWKEGDVLSLIRATRQEVRHE